MTHSEAATRDLPNGEATGPGPARLIAVGVRDEEADSGAMAWATDSAVPGHDSIYLVHAFVPLDAGGCWWEPVVRARDAREGRESLIVARALQRLRVLDTKIDIDGSALSGEAADILAEFAEVVDFLVLGEDDVVGGRPHTTLDMQLEAPCNVVSVPHDYRPEPAGSPRPVTVLVDTLDLPEAAIEVGFAEADRRGVALCVAQVWSALHEDGPRGVELLASRQEQLDGQLQYWRERSPAVGIIGELRLDDGPAALAQLRLASQLVLASARSVDLLAPDVEQLPHRCPTVSVPALT